MHERDDSGRLLRPIPTGFSRVVREERRRIDDTDFIVWIEETVQSTRYEIITEERIIACNPPMDGIDVPLSP